MLATLSPFPLYADTDGSPLDDGRLYFGTANQNPEVSPITVYWDAAGLQPAAQPIRTLNGFAVRSGTPALLYSAVDYSINVRNARGELVLHAPNSADFSNASIIQGQVAALIAALANDTLDNQGASMVGYDPALAYLTGLGQFLNYTFGRTAAEIAAGVTPTNYQYFPLDIRRYGAAVNNASDDTSAWTSALLVASQTVSGAQGNCVTMPQGVSVVSGQLTIPNRVCIRGVNKRGSVIKASAGHAGPYMFLADNGGSSMFDNALIEATLDCNDVAGLGGVESQAWQEGGGLRHVLINKFRTYGVNITAADGGAALLEIYQSEIFGSTLGCTAGVRSNAAVGFKVLLRACTIAGGNAGAGLLPRGVDLVIGSSQIEGCHFENVTDGIYFAGGGAHDIRACDGSTTNVTTLLRIDAAFTGAGAAVACLRQGATNFLVDGRAGGLGTITGFDEPVLVFDGSRSIRADGALSAWCVFDGTVAGTNPPTAGFNVTSVQRVSAGLYNISLTRQMKTGNGVSDGSCNVNNATTKASIVSASTFQIEFRVGGVATDANEVKAWCAGG